MLVTPVCSFWVFFLGKDLAQLTHQFGKGLKAARFLWWLQSWKGQGGRGAYPLLSIECFGP